jgi:hypothetical protein
VDPVGHPHAQRSPGGGERRGRAGRGRRDAQIVGGASAAAADEVAAVAKRTPRGNEIQRAIAPPVRVSASSSSPSPAWGRRREKPSTKRAAAAASRVSTQPATPARVGSLGRSERPTLARSHSAIRSRSIAVRSRSDISDPLPL